MVTIEGEEYPTFEEYLRDHDTPLSNLSEASRPELKDFVVLASTRYDKTKMVEFMMACLLVRSMDREGRLHTVVTHTERTDYSDFVGLLLVPGPVAEAMQVGTEDIKVQALMAKHLRNRNGKADTN